MIPPQSVDRNLLFGVLALQGDLIDAAMFAEVYSAWASRRHESLAHLLVERGWITPEARSEIERRVEGELQEHGGDPYATLGAMADGVARDAIRSAGGPDLDAIPETKAPAAGYVLIETMPIEPGADSRTRYSVTGLHAEGGLGRVWIARDADLNREVALKEIKPRVAENPGACRRFLKEAQVTGQLEHPNIVPVYELAHNPVDGRPFYTMRLVRGDTLKVAISAYHARRREGATDPLKRLQLLQAFVNICQAVGYAHSKGVVHRDLKPENVMLGAFGEVIVLDWGIAKMVGQPEEAEDRTRVAITDAAGFDQTVAGQLVGTPSYMAPEQAMGRTDLIDPRTDVYGLGAILYEVLTGRPPHGGETLGEVLDRIVTGETPRARQVVTSAPAALDAICARAMAKDRADRYAKPSELADEVTRWLADEPVSAYPDTVTLRLSRWARRHRTLVAGVAGLLVTAVIALSVSTGLIRRQERLKEQALRLVQSQAEALNESKQKLETALITTRRRLSQNGFQHGLAEYTAGRVGIGCRELFAAHAITDGSDPLGPAYLRVLTDRATRSGRSLAWSGSGDGISCVVFSPDGSRALTGSGEFSPGGARLWDCRTGAPLGEPMRHESGVTCAAFSPDGSRVVTGSNDGTARLWDGRTGATLCSPMRHEKLVRSVVFSPDGLRVLTASMDKTARLWDGRTGAPLGSPLRHEDPVRSAAFSPDGSRILTGPGFTAIRLWDGRTGAPLGEPIQVDSFIECAAFSTDGARIAVGTSSDARAHVRDSRTGEPVGEAMQHEGPVWSVAFSPDSSRVVTGSEDGTARMWDGHTGAPRGEPMRHRGDVRMADFSPDGSRVLTRSADGTARVWDGRTGAPLDEPMLEVASAAFSPDGDRIMTGSTDGIVRIWIDPIGTPVGEPISHDGPVWRVAFSPDGARFLTVSDNDHSIKCTVRLWDARTRKLLGEPMRHENFIYVAAFSPDGSRVVTGSRDKTARIWDGRTGASLGRPMNHVEEVYHAVFSPDGSRVITASMDKTARLWDAQTGTPLCSPMPHNEEVNSAAFSPDGSRVLTGSGTYTDGAMRLWDARTGTPLGDPMRHETYVRSVAFSPDGARILTMSDETSARLWDGQTGRPLGEPMIPRYRVRSAVFSPDGSRVLTASNDGTGRLWDGQTGAPLGEPMRHEGRVGIAAFSPDGSRVVTGSDDATARLWDGLTGAPLGEPMRHNHEVRSVAFSPDGTRVLTGAGPEYNPGAARLWDVSPMSERHRMVQLELALGVTADEEGKCSPLTEVEREARSRTLAGDEAWLGERRALIDSRTSRRREDLIGLAERQHNWFAVRYLIGRLPQGSRSTSDMLVRDGWAASELERWNEASALWTQAIDAGADPVRTGVRRCLVAVAMGRRDEAATIASDLIAKHGKSASTSDRDSIAYQLLHVPGLADPSRLLALAMSLVEGNPDAARLADYQESLGAALYRAGRAEEAKVALEKSIELREDKTPNVWACSFLAMSYGKLGDREQAIKWGEQADHAISKWLGLDRSDPNSPNWQRRLEYVWFREEMRAAGILPLATPSGPNKP